MYKSILLTAGLICCFWATVNAQDVNEKIDNIKSTLINGNYAEGLKQCEEVLKSGISDTMQLAMVYGYAGLSSEALKHKTEAIYYYKKAVALQMPQLDVYDKLINLSKKEKNDSVYEYALLEKLKVFPEYSDEVKKSLAYLYINTKQYENLLDITNELLTLHPKEVNYLYFKGVALQNLNKPEEAKVFYTETLNLDPEHSGANMSLGLILYNNGSEIFLKKKKEYESIAKPDRVDYHNYDVGIEKGRVLYRQAIPHLIKAYESGSYPDLKPIIFNAYIRLEQKEKAEPYR